MTQSSTIEKDSPLRSPGLTPVAYYQRLRPQGGPKWLKSLRDEAMTQFAQMGFPARDQEAWRFLNVSPITQCRFATSNQDQSSATSSDVQASSFRGLACQFVFVNGRYDPALSSPALPDGARIINLPEATDSDADLIQTHLAQYAGHESAPFTALNTAMFDHGLFVYVPKGVVVSTPIHVLNIAAPSNKPVMTSPRLLVVAEQDSEVAVIEDYVALASGVYFTNAVTEFVVGPNATGTHYTIQRESKKAFNISTLQVHQGRNSNFTSHALMLGSAIARNNVNPVLAGPGCTSLLNGLYVLDGEQTIDNHMLVNHASAHCNSRQHYKGVLAGRSRGSFRGRIVVSPGAQKTDAKQGNQNLLLSGDATVNSDPQLEIYADDVKCTHGSTIGQIDENAIFYLRTRGIDRQVARAMMVYAFARESLERMSLAPIRDHFTASLLDRLPYGGVLKGVI